ncbi:FAD-binding oxidoreductase [Streptomyces sp. TG1A-60]|uniref:FAD-binding oxidoreductase n=1 Tax=Streptomyces sp. TG1A-60 TaxID=3129111 RepID=UPI0030CB53CC
MIRPRTYEEALTAVRTCGAHGGIARGLGRAYGDAAQNAGGAVLDMTALDRVHAIDADDGTVLCDAGVSLHRLMEVLLPLGWFVPVTPGTRQVTVGGAIAADIHGKNHHVSGSFARHVLSLELLTADGEIRMVVPGTPLFDATAGGMGLTGVILTAAVRLLPVETAWMSVDTERAGDLDDLLARLTATDRHHRYSVAWIDLLARGASTGRGVLTRGDHAPLEALRPRQIVGRISARRCPSFLAVLKRFGEGDDGWLSFPMPGWTLALDVPAGLPGLGAFLDGFDEEVAAAGGRVYLAKDARLRPELVAAMYPRLPEFRALREELDPRGVFVSDLARRLDL